MSASIDRILDLLDNGLQRSTEAGSGFDCPDRCLRCFARPDEHSDLCAGCRAYLNGEGPDPRWLLEDWRLELLAAAVAVLVDSLAEIFAKILEAFDRIREAVAAYFDAVDFRRKLPARKAPDRHSLRAPEATPRPARNYHRRRT